MQNEFHTNFKDENNILTKKNYYIRDIISTTERMKHELEITTQRRD